MQDERESIWGLLEPSWPFRGPAGLCWVGWEGVEAVRGCPPREEARWPHVLCRKPSPVMRCSGGDFFAL